jgi:hypothetical protein
MTVSIVKLSLFLTILLNSMLFLVFNVFETRLKLNN